MDAVRKSLRLTLKQGDRNGHATNSKRSDKYGQEGTDHREGFSANTARMKKEHRKKTANDGARKNNATRTNNDEKRERKRWSKP